MTDPTAVTRVGLVRNADTTYAATAATATTSVAEVFEITLGSEQEGIIFINNAAADQGTLTYSLAAGGFWASTAALTGSVAQGTIEAITVDTAKYKSSGGKFVLTLTPASTKILKTNHLATVGYVALP